MKKFVAMMLALLMVLSLAACGAKEAEPAAEPAAEEVDNTLVALDGVVTWDEVEPYRVLVQKGDPKGLLTGINAAIAELTADNGAKMQEIVDKVAAQEVYTGDVADEIGGQTEAASSDKPVLVLGTSPDYPPFEFYSDAAMTEFAGIDIEVAKYIAESMGMQLQIETMSFENLVASLSQGDFDIVIAACEYTEERAAAADFSDPYYTDAAPMLLVKACDVEKFSTAEAIDDASVIIGAQKNTTKASLAADAFPNAANGMVMESLVPTLVTELKNGSIDILVLDGGVGTNYVGQ